MLQIKPLGEADLYMSATEVHTSVLDSMTCSAFKRPLFERLLWRCYHKILLDDMPYAWLC